ncbi:MAG: hypothetical protein Kilf2KO_05290 [Rhodospirillales bacterium]
MKLVWSRQAKTELVELRRTSVETWGRAVGLRYLEDVRDAATRAASQPASCRKLRGAFRILRVRSHYLIFHVDDAADCVTVAKVLHSAVDIERHLP